LREEPRLNGKFSFNKGGRVGLIKPASNLQDLRRKIYVKAKADKQHRIWGMYVHVCKYQTLEEAYGQKGMVEHQE